MIDSASNPLVKSIRALTTTKGRREAGQFLVEGVRATEDGLNSGVVPAVCLYNSDLLRRTERGAQLLHRLTRIAPAAGIKLFEASARALEAASDTVTSQGVVAAYPIPHWPERPADQRALIVVCDAVQDPGNLGTILRSAEAAGASHVLLSEMCVDLYSPKVVRAAAGAHFRLPTAYHLSWTRIRELLEASLMGGKVWATDADAATAYDTVDWTQGSAFIVSNEAHGTSADARRVADELGGVVAIPMASGTESLNAAVSAAVVLFEAARQRRAAVQAR